MKECHMIFNDINTLKQHIDKIHLHITRKYSCEWPECNYSTDKYHHFYYHKAGHTSKPLKCTQCDCGLTFNTTYRLKIHKRVHKVK